MVGDDNQLMGSGFVGLRGYVGFPESGPLRGMVPGTWWRPGMCLALAAVPHTKAAGGVYEE